MGNSAKQIGWVLLTMTLVAAAGAQTTKDTLINKEKQIYEAVKKQDSKTFASLLTHDSVVVGGAEVSTRDDMIRQLQDPHGGRIVSFGLDNVQVFTPSADIAILTYVNNREDVDTSGKHSKAKLRESTVWVKKNGKWLSAFHEFGSPIDDKK
jgi:ketosteroid isomerase-like protein